MLASMGNKEQNEVSIHEILVWKQFSASPEKWMSSKDVATLLAGKVAYRTVRAHTSKLVSLGILDVTEVFPGHMYRLADKAGKRNAGYLQRLQQVAKVFGV